MVFDAAGLPNLPTMITDWGLYDSVSPAEGNPEQAIRSWLWKWAGADYRFDCYCVDCSKESIFTSHGDAQVKKDEKFIPTISGGGNSRRPQMAFGDYTRTFSCSRIYSHKIVVLLRVTDTNVEKIGQFPSLASIALPHIERFQPILGDERIRELKKASGLFSHGVGAGSLIYLRRTLETIVENAIAEAKGEGAKFDLDFDKARFEEKVLEVRQYLPEEFVENRKLYSIVSAGLHGLTESECLSIFPVTLHGIELALSVEMNRREQKNKARLVRSQVQSKSAEIDRLLKGR